MTNFNNISKPDTPNTLPNELSVSSTLPQEYKNPVDVSQSVNNILQQANKSYVPTVQGVNQNLVDTSGRYPNQVLGADNEELYGQGQSFLNKAGNGLLKGLALAGTTFVDSTANLLYGTYKAISDQRFSSFYDNPLTRAMDDINQSLETQYLPNYYTKAETEGSWASRYFTTNFLFDKVIKNMGMIAGAAASGSLIGKGVSLLGDASKLFSIGKSLETAKAAEATLAEAISNGRPLSALGELKSAYQSSLAGVQRSTQVQKLLTSSLTAIGQSGIFAEQTHNIVRDNLIKEYQQQYGVDPTGDDLAELNDRADSAGAASFWLNAGLMSATNYIHLPRILGSSAKLDQQAAEALGGNINKVRLNPATGLFEEVKPGKVKAFAEKLTRVTGGFRFSPTGAFQWGALGVVPHAVETYYSKKNNTDGKDVLDAIIESTGHALTTNEGIEQFILGGIAEGLMEGPIARVANKFRRGTPSGILYERQQRAQRTQEFLRNQGPDIFTFMKESAESVSRAVELQKNREQALQNGDTRTGKDLEADYMINFLSPKIKFGLFEPVREQLLDYRRQAADPEQFRQLQDMGYAHLEDTPADFISRLDKTIAMADNMNTSLKSIRSRFGGIFTKNNDGQNERLYDEDIINKMAYTTSKIFDYDTRLQDITNQLRNYGINAEEAIGLDPNGRPTFNRDIIDALDRNTNLTPEQRTDALELMSDGAVLGMQKTEATTEYANMIANPNKYREATPEPITQETVTVGTEAVPTGTEMVTEDGRRVTVNAKNEDGTINVTFSDGETRNITDSEYRKLRTFDPVTEGSPLKDFFSEHAEDPFTVRIGNKEEQGRLVFDEPNNRLSIEYGEEGNRTRVPVTPGMFQGENPLVRLTNARTSEALEAYRASGYFSPEAFDIVNNLSKEYQQTLTDINQQISDKKAQLETVQRELDENQARLQKEGFIKGKKGLRNALGISSRLIDTQRGLTTELTNLESQRDRLQFQKEYLESQIIPESYKMFKDRLEAQKKITEDLILDNGQKVTQITKLLPKVKNAIEKAQSMIRHLTAQMSRKYESLSPYSKAVIDEVRSNPEFMHNYPDFESDTRALREAIDKIEDADIKPSQREFDNLNKALKELQAELNGAEVTSAVHEDLVQRIKDYENSLKEQEQKVEVAEAEVEPPTEIPLDAIEGFDAVIIDPDNPDDAKIPLEKWAGATTGATENWRANPQRVKETKFYHNIDGTSDRADFRRILVVKANEESLGLKGLIDKQLGSYKPTGEDTEPILAVYIKRVGDSKYYVDESGNTLTKVPELGESPLQADLDSIVYGVTRSPRLEADAKYGGGEVYSRGTPEQAIAEQAKYREFRKLVLNKSNGYVEESFGVSSGRPESDGKKKSVTENVISKETLDSRKRLIHFSKKPEEITLTSGDKIKVKKDAITVAYGDRFLSLERKTFTTKERADITNIIKEWATEYAETGNLNSEINRYLGGTLFLHRETGKISPEQLFVRDGETGPQLVLGRPGKEPLIIPFSPEGVEANKSAIQNFLKRVKQNINTKMLEDNGAFTELKYDNGQIVKKEWPTYQHYLLSGEGRTPNEIPLFTTARAGQDYARNRYSYPTERVSVDFRKLEPQDLHPNDTPPDNTFTECVG